MRNSRRSTLFLTLLALSTALTATQAAALPSNVHPASARALSHSRNLGLTPVHIGLGAGHDLRVRWPEVEEGYEPGDEPEANSGAHPGIVGKHSPAYGETAEHGSNPQARSQRRPGADNAHVKPNAAANANPSKQSKAGSGGGRGDRHGEAEPDDGSESGHRHVHNNRRNPDGSSKRMASIDARFLRSLQARQGAASEDEVDGQGEGESKLGADREEKSSRKRQDVAEADEADEPTSGTSCGDMADADRYDKDEHENGNQSCRHYHPHSASRTPSSANGPDRKRQSDSGEVDEGRESEYSAGSEQDGFGSGDAHRTRPKAHYDGRPSQPAEDVGEKQRRDHFGGVAEEGEVAEGDKAFEEGKHALTSHAAPPQDGGEDEGLGGMEGRKRHHGGLAGAAVGH